MDASLIIFVSRNTPEVLRWCLEHIVKSEGVSWELLVIDTNGDAQTLTRVSEVIPRSIVIITQERKGFATVANQALAQAKGRYVFLFDADVLLAPHVLADMVARMDAAPEVGVESLVAELAASLNISSILRRNEWRNTYRMRQTDFLCLRRTAFEQVGYIDERYTSWFGAVDYCKMVVDAGMRVQRTAHVEIVARKVEEFSAKAYVREERCVRRDMRTYFWKHEGFLVWLVLWFFAPVLAGCTYSEVIAFALRKKFL
jgi:N-acetylglucosaminyl-diphospho-decaprenol L-rhamnosyltransferase